MKPYAPRRCSKRWLDGDCPREVLAIIDVGPNDPAPERYDVIYTDVQRYENYGEWMGGYSLTPEGNGSHFELQPHQVAAYRYRMRHKYTRWSDLPEAVRNAVRRDIDEMREAA
ncbi:hypothetical protein FHT44_005073 [Mycolicibacterium sp. BK634]|uniref:hypothetical protein n=1 Tax=Mycolicibacterium sp. BK634 TaxID=2587099 RepID=UPI00161E19D1|nr:hypothetical protein [Mycolicibacterium sp. BK634]MBB3752561.1 hypothetical protein [Mycolicibacterium sp. BK634]